VCVRERESDREREREREGGRVCVSVFLSREVNRYVGIDTNTHTCVCVCVFNRMCVYRVHYQTKLN